MPLNPSHPSYSTENVWFVRLTINGTWIWFNLESPVWLELLTNQMVGNRQSANSRQPLDRLRYVFAICDSVTLTFWAENHSTSRISPSSFPIPSLKTLVSSFFELCRGQTHKHTHRHDHLIAFNMLFALCDFWPNIKWVARTHDDGLSLWQVWWL